MSKKNGLELLQQEVEIPAVVQRRAQDAFDQIHREAKLADQGIVTMEREAGRKEQTMMKRGRRTKRALVVAIATAVMVLGTMTVAVATYRKGISEGLKEIFHISPEQEQELINREDGLVQIIEQTEGDVSIEIQETETETTEVESTEEQMVTSVTRQGITISLTDVMVDGGFVNIGLRVEGVPEHEEQLRRVKLEFLVDGERLGDMGGRSVPMGDGVYENTYSINAVDDGEWGWYLGKKLEIVWTGFGYFDGSKMVTVIDDVWELSWILNGSEESYTIEMNEPLGDTGATITRIDFSPLSMRVMYDFPRETYQEKTNSGHTANLVKDPPYIKGVILKDGTVIEGIGGMGSDGHMQGSDTVYRSVRKLNYVLDFNEIESFIFLDWNTRKEYIVPIHD